MKYPFFKIVISFILVGLFAGFSICSCADDLSSFTEIDNYVKSTPKSATSSVRSLAEYLVKPAKNDTQKVRAIYYWIIDNIKYDTEALLSGDYGNISNEELIKKRMGVCGDYSSLFTAMCNYVGLESEIVEGYSRGFGYSIGTKLGNIPDHAWNTVKIDNKWQLLDTTWASGYIDSGNNFVKQQNDFYFLTPSDEFIYDHFPEDVKWQCLAKPVTKTEFENMVYLRPAFFRNGLGLISHREGIIKNGSAFTITLRAPNDVLLNVEVTKGMLESDTASTLVQRDSGNLKLNAAIPKPGNYTLRLYAKRKSDKNLYDWAADYMVVVPTADQKASSLPKALSTFIERDATLYMPMNGTLKSGASESFRISAPGAVAVAVVIGGEFTQLNKDGDIFEGQAAIKGELVQVAAKFPGSESYFVLLKYQVS